jgi:glycosyltransferase involved in cell wall biosynthesis
MTLPPLSVITPCRNGAEFIEDALRSVSRQPHVSVEHIVIDGASTDRTMEIVRQHGNVRWISEPDRGQSDAINKGFLLATGDLMGWLNVDDYYLPGGLESIAAAAREHPEADVFYGDCVFVDGGGSILRSKVEHDFDRSVLLYFGCYIPSTSTFFRRHIIESGQLLDNDYRVCMDFEYFARLARIGLNFHYVPRFIAAFRWHDSNISIRHSVRRAEERRLVQQRYGRRLYSEATLKHLVPLQRARRLLLKAWSGNLERELRVGQMLGRSTRWLDHPAGLQTCQSLASL